MNKKALFITLGVVGAIVIAVVLLFVLVFANTKKYICKSSQGNITLRYNNKEVVGYSSKGISYDLDGQQAYSKLIGIDAYLKEFKTWFESNTDGTCK